MISEGSCDTGVTQEDSSLWN